jgi:hypothetical protein
MFGHTADQCKQTVDSDGKALTTNKTNKTVIIPKNAEKTANAHAAQHSFKSLTDHDASSDEEGSQDA